MFVYVIFYKFNLISIKKKFTMSECSSESEIFGVNLDSDPDFRPGINSDEKNSGSTLSDVQVSLRPESINGHNIDSAHSDVEVVYLLLFINK